MKEDILPKNCKKCGVEIDMKAGEPCYQRDCKYYKKVSISKDIPKKVIKLQEKIPKNCNRCGAIIDMDNGKPCYQKNCNYYKKISIAEDIADSITDGIINEVQGGEGSIKQQMGENKEMLKEATDFVSEHSIAGKVARAAKGRESSDESVLDEAKSGCVWGFFKLIWNIISFPFKVILRILSFFD